VGDVWLPGREPDLDLGEEVYAWWVSYGDVAHAGLIHAHPHAADAGQTHYGSVLLDRLGIRGAFPGKSTWRVLSEEPLTLSPSLLCGCGHHGFIRDGHWQAV
jgi:hypothetical protein